MAEDVLTMRARLLDEASGALAQLRRNLQETGKGPDLAKPRKEFAELQEKVKGLAGELSGGLIPAFGKFSASTAGVVLGAGAVTAALYGLGRQLSDFANKRADLKFAAQDMGVTIAQLKAFERAAAEVRIDPGSAQQALQTFTKNAEDFKLRIGALREELHSLGAGDVVEAIGRAATPIDALRIAFERVQELQRRNPVLAQRFAESMFGTAAVARLNWEEFQKFNQALASSGKFSAEAIQQSEAFRLQWEKLERTLGGLRDRTLTSLFPAFTKGMEGINAIVTKIGDALSSALQRLDDARRKQEELRKQGGEQPPSPYPPSLFERFLGIPGFTLRPRVQNQSFGGGTGGLLHPAAFGGLSRVGGARDDVEEPIYSAVRRALRDWSQSFALGGAGGGGGGGGGAMLASFGGSAGAAGSRIGGWQRFGGGGYTNLGPSGPGSAPSGGGGAGDTRGDRNNNPGNLKFGPLAQAFGATHADDRGFAVFPNRLSGEQAQEVLVKSDRYKGLTLQQFGQKYAEGSRDWIGTVGRELGIGPGDVVNNQDPRLSGAIRKAEGTARLGPASVGGIDPHRMDPMAPAGAGITREPLAEVRTSRGRTFKVAAWARENFQRFVDNYEKAGGDLGPDTGTLGTRPGNRSYHPLGRAIDINQIGYGIRSRRGGTLPREVEDRLAEDAGLWPGSRFNDAGHFEARNRALVEAKQAQWARERMNAAIGGQQQVKAEGTVNVNVTAPSGTKVDANSDGLFQSTRVQRYRQMPETGLDGGAQ